MHPDFFQTWPICLHLGQRANSDFLCNALNYTIRRQATREGGESETTSGFTVQYPLRMNFQVVNFKDMNTCASLCMPAVVRHYCTFQGTVLYAMIKCFLFFVFVFYVHIICVKSIINLLQYIHT